MELSFKDTLVPGFDHYNERKCILKISQHADSCRLRRNRPGPRLLAGRMAQAEGMSCAKDQRLQTLEFFGNGSWGPESKER